MGRGQQQVFHDPIPLGDRIAGPMETATNLSNSILQCVLDELRQRHAKTSGFRLGVAINLVVEA
jgi:hypothetical protein